jgi:hypothetical protein
MRGYVVPYSEEVKFIGLPFHAALKWKRWVAQTARNTAGAIDILRWLRHIVGCRSPPSPPLQIADESEN